MKKLSVSSLRWGSGGIGLLLLLIMSTVTTSHVTAQAFAPDTNGHWQQIFRDDFTRPIVNSKAWKAYNGQSHTNKLDHYAASHVTARGGLLHVYSRDGVTANAQYIGPQTKYFSVVYRMRVVFPGGAPAHSQYVAADLLFHGGTQKGPEYDLPETFNADRGTLDTNIHYYNTDGSKEVQHQVLTVDTRQWHTYSISISPTFVRYRIDGKLVQESNHLPNVPEYFHFQSELFYGANSVPPTTDRMDQQIDWMTMSKWVQ